MPTTFGLTLPQIINSISTGNANVGGRTISIGEQSANVRGIRVSIITRSIRTDPNRPNYPGDAVNAARKRIDTRVKRMNEDKTTPDTRPLSGESTRDLLRRLGEVGKELVQNEAKLARLELRADLKREIGAVTAMAIAAVLGIAAFVLLALQSGQGALHTFGVRAPQAEMDGRALSNTTGPVLDPILSLRHRVRVRPGKTVRMAFSTLVGSSRTGVLDLAEGEHLVARMCQQLGCSARQGRVHTSESGKDAF